MFNPLPARWLAAFSAVAALAAMAQPAPHAPHAPPAAPPAATPAGLTYKSALEGYRPFTDEKPIPWKEANDTVRERGGWRAYANEAAGHAMPVPPKSGHEHKQEHKP
jgi:hypothetical protein